MVKVFVSHSTHDVRLVEAFVDLLESGVGLAHDAIFCSSQKGQGIKPGVEFKEFIREQLEAATCVIALVSDAYFASPFCLCELGGAWAQKKTLIPVRVPPIESKELKAVIDGLQSLAISKSADLDELRDTLDSSVGAKNVGTPRWNTKRNAFLEKLPSLPVPFKGPVPRAKFEKLQEELKEYKSHSAELEQQLTKQRKLVAELSTAKDQKAVAKIRRQHLDAVQQFEELAAAAKKVLAALPHVVVEALYYQTRNESYVPKDEDDSDGVQKSEERGLLAIDRDDGSVSPRSDNRKIETAMRAIAELGRWLNKAPEDFDSWYREEHDEAADLALRTFWERHL